MLVRAVMFVAVMFFVSATFYNNYTNEIRFPPMPANFIDGVLPILIFIFSYSPLWTLRIPSFDKNSSIFKNKVIQPWSCNLRTNNGSPYYAFSFFKQRRPFFGQNVYNNKGETIYVFFMMQLVHQCHHHQVLNCSFKEE